MSRYDAQSEFSLAYVRAVASAAGYFLQEASRTFDADGVDLTMMARGPLGVTRSPKVELQVRSMARDELEDPFPIDLGLKTYDELRDASGQLPRLLVVVVVPRDPEHWLSHAETELVLRRCGYWCSLQGEGPRANTTSVRVHIDRAQRFDVPQVQALMRRVADRGKP